ncbi:5381_t:CDS:1, partial [Gigaspora rosea]
GLVVFNNSQESSIQVVQSEDNPPLTESFQVLERIRGQNVTNSVSAKSSSKKASYGHGLGL